MDRKRSRESIALPLRRPLGRQVPTMDNLHRNTSTTGWSLIISMLTQRSVTVGTRVPTVQGGTETTFRKLVISDRLPDTHIITTLLLVTWTVENSANFAFVSICTPI